MLGNLEEEDFNELYQDVVLQNSRKPKNFKKIFCNYCASGKNPSCGDSLEIYMNFESDRLADISFQGEGCALSIAATSLLTEKLKFKTIGEIKKILSLFSIFILTQDSHINKENECRQLNALDNLAIFKGVKKYPLRIKCVMLSFRTVEQIIKDWEAENARRD